MGFFTSNGLELAAHGLAEFLQHGGQMKLVASPLLEQEDIEAFRRGYESRASIVARAVERQLDDCRIRSLPEITRNRLECIAWMVGEGRLDIKLAVPTGELLQEGHRIYHEKMGVFFDQSKDAIAFSGSANESMGGWVSNFESLDVYKSWDDPHKRVERKVQNFQDLWHNHTPRLTVLDFPKAARRRLLKLRPPSRPKRECNSRLITTIPATTMLPDLPPEIKLRGYQMEACESWLQNRGRGILEMATGSGKTVTALATAVRLVKEKESLFVVVSCPYQHLVDQWADDAQVFGFRPLRAYQSRHTWENRVNSRILDFNLGNRSSVMVITTHTTLSSDLMRDTLARISGSSLFIADEVHHLGSEQGRNSLPLDFEYRMGLSATPERWMDEDGTQVLHDYFGETVFEFTLADAISEGFLSEYYYHPHLVNLTDEELENYEQLTRRIAQLFHSKPESRNSSLLESLMRQRADILNRAQNKIEKLVELLQGERNLHHALFYCVPGQLDEVLSILGNDLGIRARRFTARESTGERMQILEDFAQGNLQALVAIRCLDEGVDVPDTRVAYILASTGNPREFIQRRGRVLRLSPGKDNAVMHDLITAPAPGISGGIRDNKVFEMERGILRRELTRFNEFALTARNRFQATGVILDLAKTYNLLDF